MKHKVTKAVFPVAGQGTRFLPATKSIPKEIMTLVDRPLIQYAIDEASEAGITEFTFVTSRGKGALECLRTCRAISLPGVATIRQRPPRGAAAGPAQWQDPCGPGPIAAPSTRAAVASDPCICTHTISVPRVNLPSNCWRGWTITGPC